MIQLIQILGDEYIVWDKMATIKYKRPANAKTNVLFQFSDKEIDDIKMQVSELNEINIVKHLNLISDKGEVFAELEKTIYIASKDYYKKKLVERKSARKTNCCN